MRKNLLIIFPLLGTILLGIFWYHKSTKQSTYLGLPTVPCFDTTLPVKQNYSLKIHIIVHDKPYPLDPIIGHDFGKCLHTIYVNDASGKVFIRANDTNTYTLGQFFDIWRKTFSPTQIGSDTGTIVVFVNNKKVKTVRNTPLLPSSTISIDLR